MATVDETVTIAALLAFDREPIRRDDPQWLVDHSVASYFETSAEHLPFGGWSSQGHIEIATMVTVPVGSSEASSAAANARTREGVAP